MPLLLAKAQPTQKPVPDAHIEITAPVADFGDLEKAEQFYREQAQALTETLAASLPQGTMHWLLIALLLKYPSYYVGSLPEFQL